MTKNELIAQIASATDLTQTQVASVVDATLDAVVAAVAAGDKVALAGFGTFEPRERAARTGRNPQSGETIEIAASTVPGFKAATAFKRAVNN